VRCCGARDAMWGRLDFQYVRGHPIADGGQTETPLVKNECGGSTINDAPHAVHMRPGYGLARFGWIFMSLGA